MRTCAIRITVKEMPKEGVKFLVPPVCKKILLECGVAEEAITLLGEGETVSAGDFELKTVCEVNSYWCFILSCLIEKNILQN